MKTSQIDLRTGTIDYFVVQRNKQRGCWLSSDIVEGSTFVIHRNARIQILRERRYEELRVKDEKARLMQEANLRRKKNDDSAKTKSLIQIAADCDVRSILKDHEDEVKRLMKECKEKGMAMVPNTMIKPWRDKHFAQMREVLKRKKIEITNVTSLSSKLSDAEAAGTNAYIREVTQALKEVNTFAGKLSQSENKPRTINRIQNPIQTHVPPPVKDEFTGEDKPRTVNHINNPTQTHNHPPVHSHNIKHNDQVDAMNKNRKELEQEIREKKPLSRELGRQQIQNEIKRKQLEQQQIQNKIDKQKLKHQQIQQEIERQRLHEQQLQFQVEASNCSHAAPQSVFETTQKLVDRSQHSVANYRNVNFARLPFASAQYLQNQYLQHTLPPRQGYNNIGLLGHSGSYPSSFNQQQHFNPHHGRLQNETNRTSAVPAFSFNHGLTSSLHHMGQNTFNAPNSAAGHGTDSAGLLQVIQGTSSNTFDGGGSQGTGNDGLRIGQQGYVGSSSESQMHQNNILNNRFLG